MTNRSEITKLENDLKVARKIARAKASTLTFGTKEYEAAFEKVRAITRQLADITPREEFCSVDSGFHRTRLVYRTARGKREVIF